MAITTFRNKYWFLSNFSESPVTLDGITYRNAEAAFQAQKAPAASRARYASMAPNEAKRAGRREKLPPDWDEKSEEVMYNVLRAKFGNPVLRQKLLDTGDEVLVEGNIWHDNKWGDCVCNKCVMRPGQNKLGLLLMKLRGELRNEK